jgi:NADPH-dependent 2,4-dienoyl-CoA reductase/sulfur reductase-like enzyme/rhodanese-related sulfurtransferase
MKLSDKISDVVIVGGVACGPKTAATLARRLQNATITVFQKEYRISYGTCGLPYFASGDINSFDELTKTSYDVPRSPDFFRRSKGFEVVPGAEVMSIDRNIEHEFGTLVLATGAVPNPPPFDVPDSPNVRPFTRPDDAIGFRRLAEQGKIGKALVVGAGFIGCELAEAAGGLWGIETILVEKEKQLLPYVLDPEMAAIAERELKRQDIEVITGASVEKIQLDGDGNPVVHIEGRDSISVDYVFLCMGVKPEATLATDCGLEIGATGGIVVDQHLRTSDPNIYAGGDCIESENRVTGQELYLPMGSLANRHGRVIAENIAGNQATFPGALGAFLVKVFDLNVGAVGLSQQAADKAGLKTEAVWGAFSDKPDYYPESKVVNLKLVFEPDSGRLVGLQAAGTGDICRRVDTMSALMQADGALDDMLAFEHGYAPPYSEALDPLHHLASMAKAQMDGRAVFINPGDDLTSYGSDTIWLDVREPSEIETEPWPHDDARGKLVTITLNDLSERLDELNKNNKFVIICKRGPRSYQASIILRGAGFENVQILSGGYQSSQL